MFQIIERYVDLQNEYLKSVQQLYLLQPTDLDPFGHALHGALKLIDAIYLRERLLTAKPRRILEVGSFLGFSTRWILEATRGTESTLVSVDPGLRHRTFDKPRAHVRRFCAEFTSRLTLMDACLSGKNESMFMRDYLNYEPRLSPRDALAIMDAVPVLTEPFGTFDFAFVDGDHNYDATLANVLLVAKMMPEGGTIVVHDAISYADVVPALENVCEATAGLTFAGVDGRSFHTCADRIAKLGARDATSIKAPLSDGLGIVVVSPRHDGK